MSGTIPPELWNIFPPQGNYLKNILKYSGYETYESIIKLKEKEELEQVFEFVKSMCDVIPDKEEMFGIFSRNPQKTMLIPGLKVIIRY